MPSVLAVELPFTPGEGVELVRRNARFDLLNVFG
jgi:hypothetical protein